MESVENGYALEPLQVDVARVQPGRTFTAPSSPPMHTNSAQLYAYSITGLLFVLLAWLNVLPHVDIVRVGNTTELIISTAAASLGLFCSMLGFAGILLNNRSFLAVYTSLLWVVFGLIVAPGYITYKTRTFNLEGKVNGE